MKYDALLSVSTTLERRFVSTFKCFGHICWSLGICLSENWSNQVYCSKLIDMSILYDLALL